MLNCYYKSQICNPSKPQSWSSLIMEKELAKIFSMMVWGIGVLRLSKHHLPFIHTSLARWSELEIHTRSAPTKWPHIQTKHHTTELLSAQTLYQKQSFNSWTAEVAFITDLKTKVLDNVFALRMDFPFKFLWDSTWTQNLLLWWRGLYGNFPSKEYWWA